MREPRRVGELVAAMREATDLPVTVKCRIGVDDQDDDSALQTFTEAVTEAGVACLIVHARKAWLQGLSPKQNREVPPLRYDRVARLKQAFPALPIVLNGGLRDLDTATGWLETLDGVMIGREAYHNPWMLAEVDARVFSDPPDSPPERESVARAYRDYVAERWHPEIPITRFTRHLSGLFQGLPGARAWRRTLSERGAARGAGPTVIDEALAARRAAAGVARAQSVC
jgi:tRNA-dihydrouridine synthase A